MKRFLLLLTLAALTWGLTAQIHRSFEPPTRHGRGLATALGLPANPAALYTFGPDGSLVPGARWFWVGWNLLRWSEAFDKDWIAVRASVSADVVAAPDGSTTADLIVDNVENENHIINQERDVPGGIYTYSVCIRPAGRNWVKLHCYMPGHGYAYAYFDVNSGTLGTVTAGSSASITTLGNGWYRCALTTRVYSGAEYWYLYLATGDEGTPYTGDGASGVYVWGAMLIPGSHTAAECAALYQKTEAQQTFHDWSGNGFDAVRGSSEAEDTNDPELTPSSRNLLAAGSTDDWTHDAWGASGGGSVNADAALAPNGTMTADQLVGDADGSWFVQTYNPSTEGLTYTLSWWDKGSGSVRVTATEAGGDYTSYGNTGYYSLEPEWVRRTLTVQDAVDGNGIRIVLPDRVESVDTVYVWGAQLETGSTATAYTNPAEESLVQGATFDGVDDYVALPDESALKPDAFTVIAVLRMHDATDGEPVISWSATDSRPAVYARSPDDWGNQSKPLIYLNSENYCYFAETIETETWHVLAVTVPGSGQTDIEESAFYLDGTALTVDTAYSADSQLSKSQPWLGRAGDYYGHMDQALIAIYSRPVSAAEIRRAYRSIARLYWDYRSICVSGWESHCQSPPLHAKLLVPWQPDGTWALAMLPRKLGLVPVWREVQ